MKNTSELANIKVNPFPASAVSRLSAVDVEAVSIETESTIKAKNLVQDYLIRCKESKQNIGNIGSVVAIVGEYGTGKTHIALQILNHIKFVQDEGLHSFYLDAPADTFLALYRDRFFPKLRKDTVFARVEEYYADVIADELSTSDVTLEAAARLRNREYSALELVRDFGLMETSFMEVLHEKLSSITEYRDFGAALTLILRPEFRDAVWEWFRGSPPDQSLIDRDITRTLDSDAAVLEAIGVFAFLFGGQGHQFVLVIDEMEKVLSSGNSKNEQSTLLAFKKLMEALGKTRALLVLVGLPDFLEALPEDAHQRISSIIRPMALSEKEVQEFVRASKIAGGLQRGLEPFNSDVIGYIAEIAGGNARKVVRLCHHTFRTADDAKSKVTRAMVRETARDQFELSSVEDVYAEITRAIDLNGWLFEKDKIFNINNKKKTNISVDFWLPVGDQGQGCALFVENSVLDKEGAKAILSKHSNFMSLNRGESGSLTILIINGHLAENFSEEVLDKFDRTVFYSIRKFGDDIDAALKGIIKRIEESSQQNVMSILLDKVNQIARQTGSLRHQIEVIEREVQRLPRDGSDIESSIKRVFAEFGRVDKPNSMHPIVASRVDETRFQIASLKKMMDWFKRDSKKMNQSNVIRLVSSIDMLDSVVENFVERFVTWELERISRPEIHKYESRDSLRDICENADREIENILESEAFYMARNFQDSFFTVNNLRRNSRNFDFHNFVKRTKSLPRDIYRINEEENFI